MVEGPAAARLAPYYDDLMGWSLVKGARIRALNRIIHRYSENHGALQWTFGGPDPGPVAMGARHLARPAVEQRCRR